MKTSISILISLIGLAAGASSKAPVEQNVSKGLTLAGAPLAIHGYDPVAYFTQGRAAVGSAKHSVNHAGATYRFTSEANLKSFQGEPGAFLPQYGGFCAYGVTVKQKFDGDPRVFEIVDDKLYFNLNPDIQIAWSKDTRGHIKQADGIWRSLKQRPAHDLLGGDQANVSGSLTAAQAPLAMHGYDPVSYFTDGLPMLGSAKHTLVHEDAAYRFVSEANLQAFERNPQGFRPQYGGFCAFGVSVGKKFDGDPTVFKIVEGKLYFNLNPDIKATWLKDLPGNLKKANGRWKDIHNRPALEL